MKKLIQSALKKASGATRVEVEYPDNLDHGDFSSNVAMVEAKKKELDPREYAEELVQKLGSEESMKKVFSKIEVAGPGFINFFISQEKLTEELRSVLELGEKYGASESGKGKKVVVDYSSPNIAKRFGIGHLRSTVIGQALYNLHSSLGYKVIGDNHIGDWGTQFGMIIAKIKKEKLDANELDIGELERLYVEFNREMEEKPELRDEAREWFKKLEEGNKEAKEIWKTIYETSIREFEHIYKLLGVDIDFSYGESFYEDKMQPVIEELEEKGLLKESEGAKIVELEDMPPAMVVKSDDTTTYLTRDLAAIKFRKEKWDPDFYIYEVGAEQKLHFQQLFKVVELLGWAEMDQFEHIAHGLIRFKHGKMSTRKGETVKLEEVLEEAIKRARKIIEASETGRELSAEEKEEVSEKVGIGAIKYFELMHHPTTDIIFDWDKLFVLEGNSAPYIQYTNARAKSVIGRAKKDRKDYIKGPQDFEGLEEEVVRTLSRFHGIIIDATKNYSPNLLANFLFELCRSYNSFYNKSRIIGEDRENERLLLTDAVSQVIRNGLDILGIEAPEKM